jgi:ankyrin repeat protein
MDDGVTPLYIASQKGHIAAVELLLQCNANIVKLTSAGYNALDIARYQKHNSIVKILLYVSYGHIKYSPEDCTSYHHNLEIAVTGEMEENNTHHNELQWY